MTRHHKPDLKQFEDEAMAEHRRDYGDGQPMTWKHWAIIAVAGWITYVFTTGLVTIFGG